MGPLGSLFYVVRMSLLKRNTVTTRRDLRFFWDPKRHMARKM